MPLAPTRRAFLASGLALPLAGLGRMLPAADGPALAPFDDLFAKFLKDNAVPGAAVAITRSGKLVLARGFGLANVAANQPVRPAALFRIASISKPFTAVAVMQLVERDKVKLDQPVRHYFHLKPFLAAKTKMDERWDKITVRHCLQHTGGWDRDRKGGFDPIGIPGRITRAMKLPGAPTPDDIVRYMMGKPLDFDPGTKYVYSNLGYLVLGRIIEAVTGQRYELWMKEHVLAPVGIHEMQLGRGLLRHRAKGEVHYYDSRKRTGPCLYPPRVGEQVPLPDGANNIEGYEAHGGWIASAVDLVRFAHAFDAGAKSPLLSAASIREMWARPAGAAGFNAKNKPRAVYYGCGWNVRPVWRGRQTNSVAHRPHRRHLDLARPPLRRPQLGDPLQHRSQCRRQGPVRPDR